MTDASLTGSTISESGQSRRFHCLPNRPAAGVSPKLASRIMGHKTPEYQAGAANINL
jgi:hypothetical protein